VGILHMLFLDLSGEKSYEFLDIKGGNRKMVPSKIFRKASSHNEKLF